MSAILGICNVTGKRIDNDKFNLLSNEYGKYVFDKSNELIKDNFAFGAKLQFITPESKSEILPFEDKVNKLIITADAIIDNRDELIAKLMLDKKSLITDSKIILESYKRWGTSCVDYLIGEYAFAIYDERKKKIFIVRDHVGKRSLYYYFNGKEIYFSTVIKPLVDVVFEKVEFDEQWITDYLTIEGAISSIDLNKTIYKGINQLPPAHYLTIENSEITINQYWYPEEIKELKLDSDDEYVEKFKSIYKEAVHSRLRTDSNIGIMLSSGLDSTSVAAFAAKELSEENRSLEAFTWVPLKDYKSNLSHSQIVNESDYVKDFTKAYPNINNNFYSFDDKNPYININELLNTFGQPYKFIENGYWINEMMKRAEEKNCKVLLDGQFGNFTISKGNFISYVYTLVKERKYITADREVKEFSSFYDGNVNVARKYIGKKILKNNGIVNGILKIKNRNVVDEYDGLVNKELRAKWNCDNRFKAVGLSLDDNKIIDCNEAKKYITNLVLFSHMGNLETELSLCYRLIRRDPTRDKRVIEYCLSLPENQYVHNGRERILIRRAVKGLVNDDIRLNYKSRGKQSADWIMRISPYNDEIFKEINAVINDENINNYFNIDYLKNIVQKLESSKMNNIFYMRHIFESIVLARYLKK